MVGDVGEMSLEDLTSHDILLTLSFLWKKLKIDMMDGENVIANHDLVK